MEGTGSAFFQIKTANNTDGGVYFRTGSTNAGAVSYLHTDNSMSFRVNSATKLKITSTGVVWAQDGKIQLGTTSGQDNYIYSTNAAGIIYQADENGHTFQTYDSSWQDRLEIKDDGHVVINQGLGVGGQDPGGSTLRVHGSIYASLGGNTSWQKVQLEGSNNTAGDALSINNWGDAEGDYWMIGVNQTMNLSGNYSKTNSGNRP